MFRMAHLIFQSPRDLRLQLRNALAVLKSLTWRRKMASCVLTGLFQAFLDRVKEAGHLCPVRLKPEAFVEVKVDVPL